MEYNSFYGGRQGTPFIIAKKYSTIADMINEFSEDVNFKEVAYYEYVIIDAADKNDADNGKVYRRIEEEPGYEYIGQIVGPAGPAPSVELDDYSTVLAKTGSTEGVLSVSEGDLIPGKDGNTYNDTIQYVYCSVRAADGSDTTVYFGFKVPYTVIELAASKVTPYTTNINPTLASSNHPFYRKWTLKIPQGIKGDAFKNFRIIIPDADTSYNDPDGNVHTLYQDKSYLVYDYYNYDNSATPEPITYYLGDYNMIDSITEQDGVVTINYTNADSQDLMAVKYITNIAITSSTGKMTVTYNTKTGSTYDTQTFNLTYVYSTALAQNGTFSYKRTTGSGTTNVTQTDKLTWIENAQVLSTGEFQTKKNTSNVWDTLATIKYITGIEGASGYLKIDYNTGEPSTYIWQGTTNSTGAIIAEESANPEPIFAEGSPWFVVENIAEE